MYYKVKYNYLREEKLTRPLNWLSDPIYFDSEPLPVNQWLNANELISNKKREEIFLDNDILNLYPIMVRRIDFVRTKPSDRILARFPYVNITEEEKELILDKQLLISEKLRDYFYQSDNRSILKWRDVLRKHLERGFVPLPFFQCFSSFVAIGRLINRTFQSARGEHFTIPDKLTKELAYLCGMVNGDGNLQKYTLSIVDFSEANIQQLKKQFYRLFSHDGRIQYRTPNSPELIVTNLWITRFFSFFTDQPIGIKKYESLREPLVFQKEPLRAYYWSGAMDADGSYKRNSPSFSSVSEHFAFDFFSYLRLNGITAVLRKGIGDVSIVYLSSESNNRLKTLLVCLHPEKQKEFLALTESPSRFGMKFIDFNSKHLTNGYFNFELFKGVYITGLAKDLREIRGTKSLRSFANALGVNHRTIADIEIDKQGIEIHLLSKLLSLNEQTLMSFLNEKLTLIRFKLRNTKPIKLLIKPNRELILIAKNIRFFKHSMILDKSTWLKKEFEKLFDVQITEYQIKNTLIGKFFSLFCNFEIENIGEKH